MLIADKLCCTSGPHTGPPPITFYSDTLRTL